MQTGILLAYLIFLSSHASANPFNYALENSRCKLHGYTVQIEVSGCEKKEVMLNTCIGVCIGYSSPNQNAAYNMITTCQSCKVKEFVDVYVELFCNGNNGQFTKFHQLRGAKTCHCAQCN